MDGRTYVTAEHWMMWHKATLFGDARIAERILTTSPTASRTPGRRSSG
ncbi:NADAR domain-containing protein [Micromonospora sp. GCM10011541]